MNARHRRRDPRAWTVITLLIAATAHAGRTGDPANYTRVALLALLTLLALLAWARVQHLEETRP
ncbi:MAG: hypothetical protein ACLGHM_09705 [Actinomycetes bacterium]